MPAGTVVGEVSATGVGPSEIQLFVPGTKCSDCGVLTMSTVSTAPLGNSVKPSSEKLSLFPVAAIAVQVRVAGSSDHILRSSLLPKMKRPSGRMLDGTSPI